MQGINKTRHAHLIDALLQTERQLSRDCECLQEAEEYRAELESMYNDYEQMLSELAKQIMAYETLFGRVKIQFIGKKLKAMKKELLVEKSFLPTCHKVSCSLTKYNPYQITKEQRGDDALF